MQPKEKQFKFIPWEYQFKPFKEMFKRRQLGVWLYLWCLKKGYQPYWHGNNLLTIRFLKVK